MKGNSTLLKLLGLFFICALFSLSAKAQTTPTPFATPSAPGPYNTSTPAAKIICSSDVITIKPQTTPTDPGVKYDWYKKDPNNTSSSSGWTWVSETSAPTYTETPSGTGYYIYRLVVKSAAGCTSAASTDYTVFVLPPLTVTLAASNNTVCEGNQSNSVLTATVTSPTSGYTYNYAWYRGTNTTPVQNGTNNTYTVTEPTASTTPVTYKVVVSYTLNNGCTAQATQDIIVAPLPATPTITFGTN
jgi:hypothetical protein